MLKRPITYTDFNDNEVTEDFYFHLSQSEILKLQVSVKGGLQEMLVRIIQAEDFKELFDEFEKIVLKAYGIKSEDGKHFEKSEEIQRKFRSSAAFDALMWELLTDAGAAATFVNGTVPKDLAEQLKTVDTSQLPAPLREIMDTPDVTVTGPLPPTQTVAPTTEKPWPPFPPKQQ